MEKVNSLLSCCYPMLLGLKKIFFLFPEQMLGFYLLPLAIESNELFADVMYCIQSFTFKCQSCEPPEFSSSSCTGTSKV